VLIVALAAWAAAWPLFVPAFVLAAGALFLALLAYLGRRARQMSDATAAVIDADANLGGELRSAHWFAARDSRDAWADFHLQAAAERIRQIRWTDLYPAVRTTRAPIATALMTLGAIGLMLTIPDQPLISRPAAAAAVTPASRVPDKALRGTPLLLSPELQRQLEALLAAAEAGDKAAADALAGNAELREALDKLGQMNDPAMLEALARALAANAGAKPQTAADALKALADRTRNAAESSAMPESMKRALEDLADDLEIVKPDQAQSEAGEAGAEAGSQGGQAAQADPSAADDMSIQFDKQSEAAGGSSMMMMSSQQADQSGGPPGSGIGGGSGSDGAAGTAAELEAALKQELIEASEDNPGGNVETEIRRRTEHGNATVGFTRGAAAAFDRGRAAAPPAVPEARRSDVQTYFIRTPQ
jgi:hypothetical protein